MLGGEPRGEGRATDSAKDALIRRGVLRGAISNYLGKFITLGTAVLLTPVLLERLGTVDYGLWVLIGSVAAFGSLLNLGLAAAVSKHIAEYQTRGEHELASRLVATTLRLTTTAGAVSIALSAALAGVFPAVFNVHPDDRTTAAWLAVLMGVAFGVSLPCTTSSAVLWGLQRYDVTNLTGTIGSLLSAGATVGILLLGGGVLGVAAVSIPVTLGIHLANVWLIRRVAPQVRFGWRGASPELARALLGFGSPLFVMHLATRLQTKTDEMVIGASMPISAVTPYAIAHALSDLPQTLTDQFIRLLLPLASQLHAESDTARLRSLYTASSRLTLAVLVPVGCTVTMLAGPILSVWVGAAYADNAHVVAILTLASLIATSQWPAGSILQGMARHRWLAVSSLGSGLVNVALSVALVQPLGLAGVALGTLIPTAVERLGVVLPVAMRVLGVSAAQAIKEVFLPALLPMLPMACVLHGLRMMVDPSSLPAIVLVAGLGLLTYALGYLAVGATRPEREGCRDALLGVLGAARTRLGRCSG